LFIQNGVEDVGVSWLCKFFVELIYAGSASDLSSYGWVIVATIVQEAGCSNGSNSTFSLGKKILCRY
jgi:hypothetical protein